MQCVENFPYPGSYISREGDAAEVDVQVRIGKPSAVFHSLRPIWSSTTPKTDIKLHLYMSIILRTVICACETWKDDTLRIKQLDVSHRRCLRFILGIPWRDHITNEDVMRITGMDNLHDIVKCRRRRVAGHVLRLSRYRIPHTAMDWEPRCVCRNRGRSTKTLRKTFKDDLAEMELNWNYAKIIAKYRSRWRKLVARCPIKSRRI